MGIETPIESSIGELPLNHMEFWNPNLCLPQFCPAIGCRHIYSPIMDYWGRGKVAWHHLSLYADSLILGSQYLALH